MGLADMFGAEDRVSVKFSDFYELVKGCTERDVMINGLKNYVPGYHILDMLDVKREIEEKKEDAE